MPQSHIIKSGSFQLLTIDRDMPVISPMSKKNLKRLPVCCLQAVIQRPANLPAVVAHPVYSSPKLRKVHILRLITQKRIYIFTPLKCKIV